MKPYKYEIYSPKQPLPHLRPKFTVDFHQIGDSGATCRIIKIDDRFLIL